MERFVNTISKQLLFVDDVHFNMDRMIILFMDGDDITVPLAWFPKLYYATPVQLAKWRVVGKGLHIRWPELDEIISVESLIH
jgi:hypothetical protein